MSVPWVPMMLNVIFPFIKSLNEKVCLFSNFGCIYCNDLLHSPRSKINTTLGELPV